MVQLNLFMRARVLIRGGEQSAEACETIGSGPSQFGSEERAASLIVCAISAVQGGHDGNDYCPSREQFPGMKDWH